jgi:transcription initiation factor TFIIB
MTIEEATHAPAPHSDKTAVDMAEVHPTVPDAVSEEHHKHERPRLSAVTSERSEIYRLRKWQIRAETQLGPRRSRTIAEAISELDRLALELGLSQEVRDLASSLFRELWKNDLLQGRRAVSMTGAAIYAACRLLSKPMQLGHIASHSGISRKDMGRAYRILARGVEMQIPVPDPKVMVPAIGSKLSLPASVQDRAIEILHLAKKANLMTGRDPWGLAAAALYISSIELHHHATQRDIADAAGVTEVTVRNRYKEIMTELGITFVWY